MRAIIDGIETLFSAKEFLPYATMKGLKPFLSNQSFRNGPLVAYDHHLKSRRMKPFHGLGDAGQESNFHPTRYVASFRHLLVDDAVPVKKYGSHH